MMGNMENFKNIRLFLKEQNYDEDVCEYILNTFLALSNYYEEYEEFEPGIVDFDEFVSKCISALKQIGKISILRDINKNEDFLRCIKPTNGIPAAYGYNKDAEGNYFPSSDNPKYYCSLGGLTNKITGEVTILFDENTKHYPSMLMETLIHELTHVNQTGFELPWYIMNRDLFIRTLREGNAIRESRYVSKYKSSFYAVPFKYDEDQNQFKNLERGDYRVYKYLYFKLEMLLGHDFMTKWAMGMEDSTFLLKAYKLIDAKYGKGTFKKLYQNFQLIFLGLNNFPVEGLKNIVIEQNDMTSFHTVDADTSLDDALREYKRISSILDNEELIEKDYESERASLVSAKQYFETLNLGDDRAKKKLEEKLNKHTKEAHRLSLEKACEILREEIDVKADFKFFKMITTTNISACQEVIKNPNYLTDAIVSIESLMVKCLLKEMDDHFKTGYENYQRYTYYISNMGNKTFNYKVMNNVKKKLNFLSMKTILQTNSDILDIKDNKPLR